MNDRRPVIAARIVLLSLLGVTSACAPKPDPAGLDDAERRARIAEMFSEYREDFPKVQNLNAEDLQARLASQDDNLVIVDVREAEEQAVSTIPGAISQDDFEADTERFREKTVVVYCTIGYRSGKYAETLAADGFDVFNLEGSVLGWAHAGGVFVDPEGNPTSRVHVYGPDWNLLPESHEAVW